MRGWTMNVANVAFNFIPGNPKCGVKVALKLFVKDFNMTLPLVFEERE
jgi:hypothetical protein